MSALGGVGAVGHGVCGDSRRRVQTGFASIVLLVSHGVSLRILCRPTREPTPATAVVAISLQ